MSVLSEIFKKSLPREILFERVLIFFFSAGLLFHLLDLTRPFVLLLTDFFLLTANGIVLYFVIRKAKSFPLLIWGILVFILTYLAELAGILTGHIFGDYYYGETMMLKIMDVPIVIAFNWLILIMATLSISLKITRLVWLVPFLSSLMIVGFDYIMEPVAMHLDYWQWANNIIPVQNYMAWFIISMVFSSVFMYMRLSVNSRILRTYFFIQLFFFLSLRIGLV